MKTLSALLLLCFCEACALEPGEIVDPASGSMETASVQQMTPKTNVDIPAVPLAPDYRSWALVLKEVQRTDSGQVRDIYVNSIGASGGKGGSFPNGTVMVMDLFAAQKDGAGNATVDADGKLVKGALLKTFVMGKDAGWGAKVDPALQNGDWLYAAYGADLAPLTDSTTSCFACHLPLGASKDWVHRYDELQGGLHPVVPSGG
jgi:hypothetical protein